MADSRPRAATKGVVGPNSFALITFRLDAFDCEPQRDLLVCAQTGSSTFCLELDVRAQGHVPKLRVGSDDSFVFKPTCVGAVTARDVDVTNVSRINVLYEWAIPPKLQSTLRVTPPAGMIRGGETIKSTWTFIPSLVKRIGARVPLVLRAPTVQRRRGERRADAPSRHPRERHGRPRAVRREHRARHRVDRRRGHLRRDRDGSRALDFGARPTRRRRAAAELLNQSSGVVRYRMDVIWDEGCSEFDADVRSTSPLV